jgi:hypothetical protein
LIWVIFMAFYTYSCGAGFSRASIGSKSTGVSKHYWTVFDVPGEPLVDSPIRTRAAVVDAY